jgi:hypothetical protein
MRCFFFFICDTARGGFQVQKGGDRVTRHCVLITLIVLDDWLQQFVKPSLLNDSDFGH